MINFSRSSPMFRAGAATVVAVLLVVQFGCVSRPPSIDLHWQLRNQVTALVPARLQTELSLEPFATGRPTGALKGAGTGFVSCLQGFGSGSCSGSMCGAMLLIILGFAVTCSAVGAVAGAIQATPGGDADRMVGTIDEVTHTLASHLSLTRKVLDKAGTIEGLTVEVVDEEKLLWLEEPERWQALRERGFVNALEIGVTEIEFAGGSGSDPELSLRMVATVRLINLSNGGESYRDELAYVVAPRNYSRWVADQGAPMRLALEEGMERLSSDIASRVFEQVDLQIPSGTWSFPGSARWGCCWLCPQSPPNDYDFWKIRLNFPVVESLQPTLAWEAFPTAGQKEALLANHGRDAGEVRYDLRLWEERGSLPGDLVYERSGLAEPQHQLEITLQPRRHYFWSMRACFDAGKGVTCTPWAWSLVPYGIACEQPSIPPFNYYRFQTP